MKRFGVVVAVTVAHGSPQLGSFPVDAHCAAQRSDALKVRQQSKKARARDFTHSLRAPPRLDRHPPRIGVGLAIRSIDKGKCQSPQ